jgi:hypothetical protein
MDNRRQRSGIDIRINKGEINMIKLNNFDKFKIIRYSVELESYILKSLEDEQVIIVPRNMFWRAERRTDIRKKESLTLIVNRKNVIFNGNEKEKIKQLSDNKDIMDVCNGDKRGPLSLKSKTKQYETKLINLANASGRKLFG